MKLFSICFVVGLLFFTTCNGNTDELDEAKRNTAIFLLTMAAPQPTVSGSCSEADGVDTCMDDYFATDFWLALYGSCWRENTFCQTANRVGRCIRADSGGEVQSQMNYYSPTFTDVSAREKCCQEPWDCKTGSHRTFQLN